MNILRQIQSRLQISVCAGTAILSALGPTPLLSAATDTVPLKEIPPNTRYAIWGDSITEMTLYPQFVETYLLACAGRTDIKVCQFGHSGERLGSLLSRQSDLDAFKPTMISFNYGMNDTEYSPYTDAKGTAYTKTMRESLDMLSGKGINHRIVVGPDAVDDLYLRDKQPDFWRGADSNGLTAAQGQNINLKHFRDIGRAAAIETGSAYADAHNRMLESFKAASKVLGPDYALGTNGNVHPSPNGHFLIAGELLRALACDGDIGTITVDLKSSNATASTGHKIVSADGSAIVVESSRYPFCYNYDPNAGVDPLSVASIAPYSGFTKDLNRFVLKVDNLDASGADVTWGSETKSFTREQLQQGINLTEHFSHTPFDSTFAHVIAAIANKQEFENYMIKLTSNFFGNDNGGNIDQNMIAVHEQKDAAVKALIVPVRHTIAIVPSGGSKNGKPVITGTMMAYATAGQPFAYRVASLNTPTEFTAADLPADLTIDTATGEITGTPTDIGTNEISLVAKNASGEGKAVLKLAVEAPVPQVPALTSLTTASATVGKPFSYQITATNAPVCYFVTSPGDKGTTPPATSLPRGLTYDTKTGVFSGSPEAAGKFPIQIAAMNARGVAIGQVTLTIAEK